MPVDNIDIFHLLFACKGTEKSRDLQIFWLNI